MAVLDSARAMAEVAALATDEIVRARAALTHLREDLTVSRSASAQASQRAVDAEADLGEALLALGMHADVQDALAACVSALGGDPAAVIYEAELRHTCGEASARLDTRTRDSQASVSGCTLTPSSSLGSQWSCDVSAVMASTVGGWVAAQGDDSATSMCGTAVAEVAEGGCGGGCREEGGPSTQVASPMGAGCWPFDGNGCEADCVETEPAVVAAACGEFWGTVDWCGVAWPPAAPAKSGEDSRTAASPCSSPGFATPVGNGLVPAAAWEADTTGLGHAAVSKRWPAGGLKVGLKVAASQGGGGGGVSGPPHSPIAPRSPSAPLTPRPPTPRRWGWRSEAATGAQRAGAAAGDQMV